MRRNKLMWVMAMVLVMGVSACKKDQETVEPEDDTWVPDESLEPTATPASTEPKLSPEQAMDQAKALYIQAEEKAAAGDWPAAVELYEQAYFLVPGKHGFALKVGTSANEAGDCSKAISYLGHFVQYAEPDKYADKLKKAKKLLDSLEKQGCE